ncbi:MAG: HAMP domain-containing histidine kinase [Deltaproteobacteria bacterium]|nr:HAMP domain-containing histidine kinase [Deltaproteobacteria bacterium]
MSISASRGSGVRLLVAFAIAIGSFVAGTVVSEHEVSKTHARTEEISGTALPAIVDLASMRTDLFHASQLLEQDLGAPPAAQGPLRQDIQDELAQARMAEERYRSRGKLPGEQGLAVTLHGQVDDVARAFDSALSVKSAVDGRQEIERRVRPALDRAETTSFDLITLNSSNASAETEAIATARARSKLVAYSLDGVSAVFTAIVALLVVRTTRREFESQAAQQRLIAARAEELEAFAGRVAHDILNPLSAINLTFDMLVRGLPPQDAAARGKASVARTRRVVDALLAFARAGARPEPGARCQVALVLGGLLEDLGRAHPTARIHLDVEPGLQVGCLPGVLSSIVGNLVGNALKYADDGVRVPEVEVHGRRVGSRVRIEVADNGPGILPTLEPTIFQPFVRGEGQEKPGIGLGLATAKRLCEAHGGGIGFRSKLGVGTTFFVELPEAMPQQSELVGASPGAQAH